MNRPLFAGRYPFGYEGPELAAELLEQFAKKPEARQACKLANLLVDAARNGDSAFFRKLGDWVDLAHGRKRPGLKLDLGAIDGVIHEFLGMFEDRDPPVRPTATDFVEILSGLGLNVSESTIKARLRLLRGKSKPGRPRKSADSP